VRVIRRISYKPLSYHLNFRAGNRAGSYGCGADPAGVAAIVDNAGVVPGWSSPGPGEYVGVFFRKGVTKAYPELVEGNERGRWMEVRMRRVVVI